METQRQLLEELDVLEWAITQRFKRNPALSKAIGLGKSDSVFDNVPKRSHKETLTQQHELKYFVKQHAAARARVSRGFESVKADAEKFKDPHRKFDVLLQLISDVEAKNPPQSNANAVDLTKRYALYLSAPSNEALLRRKKRKFFLAAEASHIANEMDQIFTASEMYGKYVDLTTFYNMYQALGGPTITYTEYLKSYLRFEGSSSKTEYTYYLESLLKYLESFYRGLHPFSTIQYPEFSESARTETLKDGVENSNGEVFCKACNKTFAKKTVYDGHLGGKKHKKNASNLEANMGDGKSTPSSDASHHLILQHKISHLSVLLDDVIRNTIDDHHRRAGLSERERMLEIVAVQGEESEDTVIDSDSEDHHDADEVDHDGLYAKDLPMGPDNIPIPLWLYKLQGLHRSYTCEICGNVSYKGRLQFNKHFTLPKHVHGLTCLGINEDSIQLFANISTIAEAEELWGKIKKNKRKVEEIEEDAIEVEDEEGNIMLQKDYLELKKQGLI